MNEEAESELPGTSVTRTADESLDEVILESFPASDPPASWSGLAQPDLIERVERDTGEEQVRDN